MRGELFDKRKLHAITRYVIYAPQPYTRSVAQFVELANLCAQDNAQMMGFVALHNGALLFKLFNEKSPPHATILSQLANIKFGCAERTYPKMSFTFSKMDELRSAGLLSTFSEAPNCSMSLRCSRVNFVGVSTRT